MGEPERIVLFVCTENRFRSQIAEAYFNAKAPGWQAVSAGSKPAERALIERIKGGRCRRLEGGA